MLNEVLTRGLGPSEIYFELLGRTWPMNAMCSVEIDGAVDVGAVQRAWDSLAAQVPVIGAHVERISGHEAQMVFGASRETAPIVVHDNEELAWASESQTAIDLEAGPLVRCSLVTKESGSTVLIAAHHSALDGRCLAELAMLFATVLVDGGDIGDHPLTRPTSSLHRMTDGRPIGAGELRSAVATARDVRGESGYVGAAQPVEWHRPSLDVPRNIGFALFDLSADETSGLAAWARSQQATVHGALSAAVLRAAASVAPGPDRLGLSSSVDLRSRFESPEHGWVGQAAGVVSASYDTTDASGPTARQISSDIRRRVDRGEAEMVYALSGAGRFPVDHTADQVVRRWTEQATPSICIGNLGVVRGSAPGTVRRIRAGLAPIPNQVAYVAATTFRDRLSVSVAFDRNRLTIDGDVLAASIHVQVLQLATADRSAVAR